jgi:hypothetical protein
MHKLLDYTAWERAGLTEYKRDDSFARKLRKIFKADDVDALSDDERDEIAAELGDNGDDDTGGDDHELSRLADLCVEAAEGAATRADALRYLLHTARGRSLAAAHAKHMKGNNMPTKIDVNSVTEADLEKAIRKYAQGLYPSLSPAKAFSECFCADTEEGRALRKAHAAIRDSQFAKATLMPILPVSTSVGGTRADDQSVNNPKPALDQITELANRMRAASPDLSHAQAFARAYAANPELARREREENRPRAV